MAELAGGIEEDYRAQWIELGRPIPLRVERSGYDDDIVSWEVLWHNSLWDGKSGCASPIAEFTTWQEAQDWAQAESANSKVYRIGRDRIVGPMPRGWNE